MFSVLKKADKLNLSLSLTGGIVSLTGSNITECI